MTFDEQMEIVWRGERPSRPTILALDLSLTGTGWCLNGDGGVLRSRLRGWDRIAEITQAMFAKTFGVDVVVIEGYAYGAKGQAVYQLAELGGIVRFWLYNHHLTTIEVNPTTLKMFATGKGNAGKPQMLLAAQHRFHLPKHIYDDNIVDAYLLWAMAREAYGGPIAKVPAPQAAVVHRLDWPRLLPRRQSA